jgi:ubiquinone/menaquinone biosynthesis C-methylase UbiE
MNYFAHASAAMRYASSRPYFHPVVIERIKAHLKLEQPILNALDVACGTGQSSLALKAICQNVTGVDVSSEMLEFARQNPEIEFLESGAENLPFEDSSFDLLTVSNAFHWFDRSRFLGEANRVLKPGTWLVVYFNAWRSKMLEKPGVLEAWGNRHFERYPTPPRDNEPMTETEASRYGFRFDKPETYENTVVFSLEQCVNYLSTQSNMIAKVEQGTLKLEDALSQIRNEIEPIFPGESATFGFSGWIWYLQKT